MTKFKNRMTEHQSPRYPEINFLDQHAVLLITSFKRLTGGELLPGIKYEEGIGRLLYEAPFALVSHDTADVPVFNYANLTAQRLFEMDWERITGIPSRESAVATDRSAREKLMAQVARDGFMQGYTGMRVSASGKRFRIEDTTIWNLVDAYGHYHGQAAKINRWSFPDNMNCLDE